MKLQFSTHEVAQYLNKEDFVSDVFHQINKDLLTVEMEIKYSGNIETAYVEFTTQLHDIISYLIKPESHGLANLIYRIDLDEKKVANSFKAEDENGIALALSNLIIERELQKIVLRKSFK